MNAEIEDIIREQVVRFYPELAGGSVKISILLPTRRLHKSMIYEVRISNDRHFSKDVIIKQRVYNPNYKNDIVSGTKRELENFRLLEKRGRGKFRVVKALGALEEKGLLFIEKVPGEKLSDVLKSFAKQRPSIERLEEVKGYFFKTGQWLKAFHESGATGKTEKIPVDEDIRKAGEIFNVLGWHAKWVQSDVALRQMELLKREVASAVVPIVLKHADFQPRNVLIQNGEPVIFDVGGCRPALSLHDASDFLIGLFNFNLLHPFSKFTRPAQAECAKAFLEGYFAHQPKPWPAIEFLLILCAIQQLESVFQRNRASFLRTVWAVYYYQKLFVWLKGWDIQK